MAGRLLVWRLSHLHLQIAAAAAAAAALLCAQTKHVQHQLRQAAEQPAGCQHGTGYKVHSLSPQPLVDLAPQGGAGCHAQPKVQACKPWAGRAGAACDLAERCLPSAGC